MMARELQGRNPPPTYSAQPFHHCSRSLQALARLSHCLSSLPQLSIEPMAYEFFASAPFRGATPSAALPRPFASSYYNYLRHERKKILLNPGN